MNDEPPLYVTVGRPPFDPDRVVCDGCGAFEPIERMAEIKLMDGTPERALGGSTVAVQHYCPACFGKLFEFEAASGGRQPEV